jgi:hypothetical protein
MNQTQINYWKKKKLQQQQQNQNPFCLQKTCETINLVSQKKYVLALSLSLMQTKIDEIT